MLGSGRSWSRSWSWSRTRLLLMLLLAFVHTTSLKAQAPTLGRLVAGQWRCFLEDLTSGRTLARVFSLTKEEDSCYPDVTVHLYSGWPPRRKVIDPRRQAWLRWSGWDPWKRTIVLVHGFNGGHQKAPISTLRDAYLQAGAYNVLSVDWEPLSRYPCYADAVRASRMAARCGAQVLEALQASLTSSRTSRTSSRPFSRPSSRTSRGSEPPSAPADLRLATCVGHSLGAHICGMLSRLMPSRLYKVVALDPARPRIQRLLGKDRLDPGDARVVQSLHTNAGFYGEYPPVGHMSLCLNGGRLQPQCRGSTFYGKPMFPPKLKLNNHFLSVCYLAQLLREPVGVPAVPCDQHCRRVPTGLPLSLRLADATADRTRGTYCVDMALDDPCRIDL